MLSINKHFRKRCSCHLKGKYIVERVLETFIEQALGGEVDAYMWKFLAPPLPFTRHPKDLLSASYGPQDSFSGLLEVLFLH
jgi:hypothetical protein